MRKSFLVTVIFHPFVEQLGRGKNIHCFSSKTFPTLEGGGRFFLFNYFSGEIPRKSQTGMQKCWSCSLVPGLPRQLSSLTVRITVRSVIRTASDDSCGGLDTRLQVKHERSRIYRFAHAKVDTFDQIFKKLSFLLYLMWPGLRNNGFTYHGLNRLPYIWIRSGVVFYLPSPRPRARDGILSGTWPKVRKVCKPLEDAIRQQFLPSLTGQNPFSDADRNLMALPVRFGGLGIINPSQQCTPNNSMAEKTTAPLVALILQQSHSYPPEVKAEQLKARSSGVAKLGHTGARALATGSCAPPLQVLLKIIGAECTVINRELGAKSAQKC